MLLKKNVLFKLIKNEHSDLKYKNYAFTVLFYNLVL